MPRPGIHTVKNGVEYIRWERVRQYLEEFGFPTSGENENLPEYITENTFYRLCFKAENEAARNFQNTVFDEALPAIRKHGMYATPQAVERMLYRNQKGKLHPYSQYDHDLFELKEKHNDKTEWSGTQLMFTPKGREHFYRLTRH